MQWIPSYSNMACGYAHLPPLSLQFQNDTERPLWPAYTSLRPRGIITACSPLERDLLDLDEEVFFKAMVEVFTEFID